MEVGYWAAQEQYSMERLLELVAEAEKGGIRSTMTSDHFHPWWHDNAFGNFTWVWISAAAARTKKMRFITGVTAPIYRYHPAIIAQAFASLDVLYPGRIGLGLGSGEAMNEAPLGFDWPRAGARLKRTREAIRIIRKLWGQEEDQDDGFTSFNGEYFLLRDAKLYTRPSTRIPLYMAAAGQQSVKTAAELADGLITYLQPEKAGKVLETFDKNLKKSNQGPKPKIAEYKVSFSDDYEKALKSTYFWRATLIEGVFSSDISDPRKLQEKALKEVSDKQLEKSIDIITSIEDSISSIEKYFKAGFTAVYVHSTSPDELRFVREFSKKVYPYFSKDAKATRKRLISEA
jgi:coenzyme F420-dependent glucose-6-phosphate dehydrogenase